MCPARQARCPGSPYQMSRPARSGASARQARCLGSPARVARLARPGASAGQVARLGKPGAPACQARCPGSSGQVPRLARSGASARLVRLARPGAPTRQARCPGSPGQVPRPARPGASHRQATSRCRGFARPGAMLRTYQVTRLARVFGSRVLDIRISDLSGCLDSVDPAIPKFPHFRKPRISASHHWTNLYLNLR